MGRTECSLVLLSVLVACGDGPADPDAGDSEASVEDAGPVGIAAPPDIPWLDLGRPPIVEPLLTPCPAGWSEVVRGDGPVRCHPYGGEPDVCPDGSRHFVGDSEKAATMKRSWYAPASRFGERARERPA